MACYNRGCRTEKADGGIHPLYINIFSTLHITEDDELHSKPAALQQHSAV